MGRCRGPLQPTSAGAGLASCCRPGCDPRLPPRRGLRGRRRPGQRGCAVQGRPRRGRAGVMVDTGPGAWHPGDTRATRPPWLPSSTGRLHCPVTGRAVPSRRPLLVKSSASGDLSQVRRPPPPPSRIAIRPWRCSALLSAVDYSQRRPHPESPFASTLRAVQAAKRRPVSAGPRSLPPSHSAERTASRPAPPPLRAASPPASGLCAGAHSGNSSRAGPGEWRKRGDGAAVCGARTGQGLPATQAQSTPQRRGTPRHAAAQSITLAQCAAVAASRAAQLVRIDAERSGARKPCWNRETKSPIPASSPPISSYQAPRPG